MTEAERKRRLALEAADGRLVTSRPADVRWLLCGRGRPVDAAAPTSPYTVVLEDGRAAVHFQDIESSRVETEERFEELGYEPVPYPWFEGNGVEDTAPVLDELRRELGAEERERYRAAGAAVAEAMRATVAELKPELRELDAAALLAGQARERGLFPAVLLVAGAERQKLHRHPLPTEARLGPHALLAITAERDGLHVSLTRLVSFGRPPRELERLVRSTAEVDAAMLEASRPVRRSVTSSRPRNGRTRGRAFRTSGVDTTRAVSPVTAAARSSASPASRRGFRPRPPSPGTRPSPAARSQRTPCSSPAKGSRRSRGRRSWRAGDRAGAEARHRRALSLWTNRHTLVTPAGMLL